MSVAPFRKVSCRSEPLPLEHWLHITTNSRKHFPDFLSLPFVGSPCCFLCARTYSSGNKNGAFGKPCLCPRDTRHFRHFRRFTGLEQQSPFLTGCSENSSFFTVFVKNPRRFDGTKALFTKGTVFGTPNIWAELLPRTRVWLFLFVGALFGLKHRKIIRKSPERALFCSALKSGCAKLWSWSVFECFKCFAPSVPGI